MWVSVGHLNGSFCCLDSIISGFLVGRIWHQKSLWANGEMAQVGQGAWTAARTVGQEGG